jgi:hypothetical protein
MRWRRRAIVAGVVWLVIARIDEAVGVRLEVAPCYLACTTLTRVYVRQYFLAAPVLFGLCVLALFDAHLESEKRVLAAVSVALTLAIVTLAVSGKCAMRTYAV